MTTIGRAARQLPRTIDLPLRPTGLLAACSRRELAQIGRRCDVVEVDAGLSVQPVQPLHWVYVVMDGLLAVSSPDVAFVVGDDGAVGARSALASRMPTASIAALADSTLLVTSVPEFVGLVGALRGLALGTVRHLAREAELL